jgi:hypothetical protein
MHPLLGRKFLVAVLTLAGAFVLALKGLLTGDFALIASVVNGSFNAADTLITRKFAGHTNREGSTEEEQ